MSTHDSVSPDDFKIALSHWASGVTVVTAAGPTGLTVSSFTSVSLDPPLILVCVANDAGGHEGLVEAPGFAVHVLERDERHLSQQFARPGDKFRGVDYDAGPFGAPLLHGCLTRLVCQRHDTAGGGDHTVLIGRVVQVDVRAGEPLLYYRGAYRGLDPR